jgi:hypothetical protein
MISKDFREFVALLNAAEVRYLVVGGYAVAVHGYPRYTKDLDIWIESSPLNADRLLRALHQFGFGTLDIDADDFLQKDQIIQLGYPPNRIDLLTSLEGLSFDDCYRDKMTVSIENLEIDFIDLANLKKNKAATGRAQDLADLDHLSGGDE